MCDNLLMITKVDEKCWCLKGTESCYGNKAERKLYSALKQNVSMVTCWGGPQYLLQGWFIIYIETNIHYSIDLLTGKFRYNTQNDTGSLYKIQSETHFLLIQIWRYIYNILAKFSVWVRSHTIAGHTLKRSAECDLVRAHSIKLALGWVTAN